MGQLTFHSDSTQSTPVSRPNFEPEYSPVSFLLVVAPPPPSTSGAAAPHAHADRSEGERGERKREMAGRLTAAGARILGGGGGAAACAAGSALRHRAGMGLPAGRHIVPDKPVSPAPPLLRTLNPNPIQAEIPFLSRYLLGF
jgi:hypothetical protein